MRRRSWRWGLQSRNKKLQCACTWQGHSFALHRARCAALHRRLAAVARRRDGERKSTTCRNSTSGVLVDVSLADWHMDLRGVCDKQFFSPILFNPFFLKPVVATYTWLNMHAHWYNTLAIIYHIVIHARTTPPTLSARVSQ